MTTPESDSLRQQLGIEWKDHFQSRTQSWRTLQIEALLLVALLGADLRFANVWLMFAMAFLVLFSGLFGFAFTMLHWRVQERNFRNIDKIEAALGLKGVIEGHHSSGVRPSQLVDPRSTLAVVMLARIHLLVILFAPIYVIGRTVFG